VGRLSIAFDGAIVVGFDGALKVEVPAIEGTRGERTTAVLMPLGLFLFIYFLLQSKLLQFLEQNGLKFEIRCSCSQPFIIIYLLF